MFFNVPFLLEYLDKTYKYCVVYTRTLEEADDIKKHL